jgi:hypothetical protein
MPLCTEYQPTVVRGHLCVDHIRAEGPVHGLEQTSTRQPLSFRKAPQADLGATTSRVPHPTQNGHFQGLSGGNIK